MKIVINTGIGGFSITRQAAEFMAANGSERAKKELEESSEDDWFGYGYVSGLCGGYDRTDPILVKAIEQMGQKACNECELKVVEIPDGIEYYIYEDECGCETIHEKHRTWY